MGGIIFLTKTGIKWSFGYSSRGKMWDRDLKITKDNFVRKIASTGYICLPRYKYCEAEGHLKVRSGLQYTVINSATMIVKYIDNSKF